MIKSEESSSNSRAVARFVTSHPQTPIELAAPDKPGGKLPLRRQHARLIACLDIAIDRVLLKTFSENAFPLLPEKRHRHREALLAAAVESGSGDIEEELKSNKDYAQWLATIVCSNSACYSQIF